MITVLISRDENTAGVIKQHLDESPFKNEFFVLESPDNLFSAVPDERIPDLVIADTRYIPTGMIAGLKKYCSYLVLTSSEKSDAYEAIESGAFDFLLKPFSKNRFELMLKKVFLDSPNPSTTTLHKGKKEYTYGYSYSPMGSIIFVKSGVKIHKMNLSDIRYLEKQGNYFIVHAKNRGKIILRMNFQKIMELLPSSEFIRVHKSYIVSLRHIEFIEGNEIIVDNEIIPLSSAYKESLIEMISIPE
jgi:DNA-binding LytR/AlgR family response regulator